MTKEQTDMLIKVSIKGSVDSRSFDKESIEILEFLLKEKFLNSKCIAGIPPRSGYQIYTISELGKSKIDSLENSAKRMKTARNASLRKSIREWITTVVAVLALVLSIISLVLQQSK